MKGYPIFLVGLADKRCVVVGGGSEAERKVTGLLECDAAVTVISADLTAQLRLWADGGTLTWVPRAYQPGDLQGAYLAIVTDSSPTMRAAIYREAETEHVLLNVEDDASHSHFTTGAVMRQGALTIAVSTSGCAPALAVRLRQQLERTFGPEYALFLDWLRAVRAPLAARYPNFSERRARWYALVDSEILSWLRQGRVDLARQRLAEIIADTTVDTGESTLDAWEVSAGQTDKS
jgi:siroheme synthase-like protein